MNAALERLSSFPRVALWVLQGNENAIAFYRACGFSPDGAQATLSRGTPCVELRMVLEQTP